MARLIADLFTISRCGCHPNEALIGKPPVLRVKQFSSFGAVVDAYNSSLIRSTPTELSYEITNANWASAVNHALVFGVLMTVVNAYDASLTRSTPTGLSVARWSIAGTRVGNYALLGGGYTSSSPSSTKMSKVVDAYNASLTRSTPTTLSVSRASLAATSIGNYALFGGGGYSGTSLKDTVDAYNISLTRTTPTVLSVARNNLAAGSAGGYAIFAGGRGTGNEVLGTVDAYDASLTRSVLTPFSIAKSGPSAASVGDYVLFGGGYTTTYTDTVEVRPIK